MSSPPLFSGVRVVRCLGLWVVFSRSLLDRCVVCCFDLQLLIGLLNSLNFSYEQFTRHDISGKTNCELELNNHSLTNNWRNVMFSFQAKHHIYHPIMYYNKKRLETNQGCFYFFFVLVLSFSLYLKVIHIFSFVFV